MSEQSPGRASPAPGTGRGYRRRRASDLRGTPPSSTDGALTATIDAMRTVLGVAGAGAVGALARWGLSSAIGSRASGLPWGTLVVNVTGSFVLGLLFVVLTERVESSAAMRLSLMTGLLGAYTTFSTFSLETFRLLEGGAWGGAALNVAGNLVLGLVAVAVGVAVGRAL
jgi:CrcB protein